MIDCELLHSVFFQECQKMIKANKRRVLDWKCLLTHITLNTTSSANICKQLKLIEQLETSHCKANQNNQNSSLHIWPIWVITAMPYAINFWQYFLAINFCGNQLLCECEIGDWVIVCGGSPPSPDSPHLLPEEGGGATLIGDQYTQSRGALSACWPNKCFLPDPSSGGEFSMQRISTEQSQKHSGPDKAQHYHNNVIVKEWVLIPCLDLNT